MKQELIKSIVKIGNSAGVVLPRKWLNGTAKIELVRKPLNIKKDVLEILDKYLEDIIGIYLIGSYARGEQTKESDVDVLAVTNNINKKIEIDKYNLILIRKDALEKSIQETALPFISMILEAKTIINSDLIKKYRKEIKITKKNLKPIIELAKSALDVIRKVLNLDKKWPSNSDDSTAYSLVLNIRSLYLIDCLKRNREGSTKGLKYLIKTVSGSLQAYEGYLRVKKNKKMREELPLEESEKLYTYLEKEVEKAEKWLKEKRD